MAWMDGVDEVLEGRKWTKWTEGRIQARTTRDAHEQARQPETHTDKHGRTAVIFPDQRRREDGRMRRRRGGNAGRGLVGRQGRA